MSTIKQLLQTTIYNLILDEPFLGNLIQEVNLTVSGACPTAFMGFNPKTLKFQMGVNPEFFGERLNPEQRVAVIKHELLHFVHLHLKRMKFTDVPEHEKRLWNIAADMAINQYIQNLPNGCDQCPPMNSGENCKNPKCPHRCVDVNDWKQQDGSDMPKLKSMEFYFDALKQSLENKTKGKGEKDWRKDFEGRKEAQKKDEKGQPEWGTGPTNPNDETYDRYKGFDEHDWENLSEEDKQKFLKEMKDVCERTIEKSSYGHTVIPEHVKELIRELDAQIRDLDYKAILKMAIKRSITITDRRGTWTRPNKRYGVYAPGTTVGKLPRVNIYQDTSGSMSHRELNESNLIIDRFLGLGAKVCNLGLWNTDLYYFKKRKLYSKLEDGAFEGGGTNLQPVIDHIISTKPELSLILTDGYYDSVVGNPETPVIFIIRADNAIDHPAAHIGKTIKFSSIK